MFKRKRYYLFNKLITCSFCLSLAFGNERDTLSQLPQSISFAGANFYWVENEASPNHYIWIHGDEKTAKMALDHHISIFPGRAYFIQSDTREVPFLETKIDPNRVFSRSGSLNALKKFKMEWAPGTLRRALNDLDESRELFLNTIFPKNGGVLIAVHNNFRGYNVKYELKHSRKTSLKKNQNPRDFILCTYEDDFDKLAEGPYSVVLQDTMKEYDDGSLSWESIRRNVRYVNIETRLGYLTKQKQMLEFVGKTLD